MRKLAVLSGILALASFTVATPVQIGVFDGALDDDFESYPNFTPVGSSFDFLGGFANNSSNDVNDIWISSSHGLGGSKGGVGGSQFMVGNDGAGGAWNITFDSPVLRFGGYWQSAFDDSTLTFDIYDGAMAFSGTFTVTPPNSGDLTWYGFEDTAGIGKVVVSSSQPFQIVDNFTVDVVPEPATMAVLGVGVAALARRRRK